MSGPAVHTHGEHPLLKFTAVLQSAAVQIDLLNWRWKLSWRMTCRGSIWRPASGCPSVPPQLWSSPTREPQSSEQNRGLRNAAPAAQYATKRTRPMADLSFVLCLYLVSHRGSRVDITSNKFPVGIIFHHMVIFFWLTVIWMKAGFISTLIPPTKKVFVFLDTAIKTLVLYMYYFIKNKNSTVL